MRITWHRHENALHFLLMDEPVLSRRQVSPGVLELLDSDGRLVRVDALGLPATLGATYHGGEDWLDIRLREGEFQRLLHVLPKLVISLGSNDEALCIQLLDARRGWGVPLEDIVLLVLEAAAADGRTEEMVELPEGVEPEQHRRMVDLMAARGWQASKTHGGQEQAESTLLPRSVTFARRE